MLENNSNNEVTELTKAFEKEIDNFYSDLFDGATDEIKQMLIQHKSKLYKYLTEDFLSLVQFDLFSTSELRAKTIVGFFKFIIIIQNSVHKGKVKGLIDSFEASNITLVKTNELKKIVKRNIVMGGKTLTDEKREMYNSILEIQDKKIIKHGPGTHLSSLTASVKLYSKENKKRFSEKKVKSIAQSISNHLKKGNLRR